MIKNLKRMFWKGSFRFYFLFFMNYLLMVGEVLMCDLLFCQLGYVKRR